MRRQVQKIDPHFLPKIVVAWFLRENLREAKGRSSQEDFSTAVDVAA